MPSRIPFLCQGCLSRGEEYSLSDYYQKRLCYGKCNHFLCLQCVSRDPEQDCPICGEPKAFEFKTINYGASSLYEHLLNQPIDIFKDFLKETVYMSRCALCLEEGKELRLCVKCEMKLPEDERFIMPIPPPICLLIECLRRNRLFRLPEERRRIHAERNPTSLTDTNYEFSVYDYSKLPHFFSRVYCSDCLLDRHGEIEERNIERIKILFDKRGESPKPEDLETHNPDKNETPKLKDLKNYDKEIKQITFKITRELLWTCLNNTKDFKLLNSRQN